jgi:hypothetical protein
MTFIVFRFASTDNYYKGKNNCIGANNRQDDDKGENDENCKYSLLVCILIIVQMTMLILDTDFVTIIS